MPNCQLCGKTVDSSYYEIDPGVVAHRACWFDEKRQEQSEEWWKDGGHESVTAGA